MPIQSGSTRCQPKNPSNSGLQSDYFSPPFKNALININAYEAEGSKMAREKSSYLVRFNRILVWVSLIPFVFYTISGYGIRYPKLIGELTGGILTRALSIHYHNVLAAPVLLLLLIHVLIGLKVTLTRLGVSEGKLLYAFLIALGAFATALLLIVQTLGPSIG